jgi:acetyl-CoA C-acetyltransferase
VVVSNSDTKSTDERQRHYTSLLSSILKRKMPIMRVPAVCGGGGAAFWTGIQMNYNNVLVLGVDKVASGTTPIITKEIMHASENMWEQDEGLIFPAVNALVAQQHMQNYGTTHDDLALIAYKNHCNAYLNPKAPFFKKKVTLDTIKNGPMISSPLTLYDCSLTVNGAAAAIISNDKSDVAIKGSGLATDYIAPFERDDLTTWNCTVESAKVAYAQAGISSEDIDVAELHDAFSIVELIAYEDLGFCKKGEGKNLIRDGIVNLDGKLPVNTSGGLKARGHPISPTGVAQIYEIVNQLRNKCDERQVKSPTYGLTHNIGGAGGTGVVHIFKKV